MAILVGEYETGAGTLRRRWPEIGLVIAACALASGSANASPPVHDWVPVPGQPGIRVDLNSIEHGHFPTGPEMDGSPVADTRALVDEFGQIWFEPFWCSGHVKLGQTVSGTIGPSGTTTRDDNEGNAVQDFVCSVKPRRR